MSEPTLPTRNDGEIRIVGVGKEYDSGVPALNDVNLTIPAGQFTVLVGPSGCGKSTLLRIVAGLESVTRGSIEIDGVDVVDRDPQDRNLAMVFQSYALYPHLTVRDNLAFPLRMHGVGKQERLRLADETLAVLGLQAFADRKPAALSGGQRQRVAMGRAIVRQPKAFLMDEPLSNLDAQLRGDMRAEISQLQERTGITTIYVTHDQTEAMTMAHQVVVMRPLSDGVTTNIAQVGSPTDLYRNPVNTFVATFLGNPTMNLVVSDVLDGSTLQMGSSTATFTRPDVRAVLADRVGKSVTVGIRPEAFSTGSGRGGAAELDVEVTRAEFMGAALEARFTIAGLDPGRVPSRAGGSCLASLDGSNSVPAYGPLQLYFNPDHVTLFDQESGAALTRRDPAEAAPAVIPVDDDAFVTLDGHT